MPVKKKTEEQTEVEEVLQKGGVAQSHEVHNHVKGDRDIHFGPYVKITKVHRNAQFEETLNGLDVFVFNEVELTSGLTWRAETGLTIEVPYGYVGIFSLNEDISKEGIMMLSSPLLSGTKELTFLLRAVDNWVLLRKGRKLGTILFVKQEHLTLLTAQ